MNLFRWSVPVPASLNLTTMQFCFGMLLQACLHQLHARYAQQAARKVNLTRTSSRSRANGAGKGRGGAGLIA